MLALLLGSVMALLQPAGGDEVGDLGEGGALAVVQVAERDGLKIPERVCADNVGVALCQPVPCTDCVWQYAEFDFASLQVAAPDHLSTRPCRVVYFFDQRQPVG